jgi:type VI secretion system secreted protein VgrG
MAEVREATISLPIIGSPVLERLEVWERLSEFFLINATVLCDEMPDFLPILGNAVSITITRIGETVRYFHGLLYEANYIDFDESGYRYHLILRPWLYKLSRNLDYVIFQDKSAVDIIKAVFEARSCSDVDFSKLSGSTNTRDYCVQYRESDFSFVSRLMEEEGIGYYFIHQKDRHVMVLSNGRSSYPTSSYSSLPFNAAGGVQTYQDRFWTWNETVTTSAEASVSLRNFDFERPDTPRTGAYSAGEAVPGDVAEIYDFPAAFLETVDGDTRGQMILEAARRQRRAYHGEGNAIALACGDLFTLDQHALDRLNQDYLVVGLSYRLEGQTFRSGAGASGNDISVLVEAVPADNPWRPPFVTPKPVARGPETAIVTGPSGEVIYTDKYGRVKVRFHWDRGTTPPEGSTCFIRVSHNSAGAGFGNIILPRVGQEVIVDFLDGDPDRPIITGRVYNASRMQTYALPDNMTRSVWRSQTVGPSGDYSGAENPPGGEPGCNEIRMEDKGGSEELYVYAQRLRTTWIRLDDSFKLGRDQTQRIGRDRTTNIKNNDTSTVEQGDMKTTVSMGNLAISVSQGNMTTDVAMGNYSLKTDLGSVTVEAMQQIELKVGQNSIVIDQTGVTIKGMMVSIQAQVSLQAKGMMTDVEGSALTTVKGGIVMIN